ncbi:MAG: hypothetical protein JWP88_497 [Flaviaesturariibacter sp.]|nr:hypothetical protein [Flaviaesturariibacter sp.]
MENSYQTNTAPASSDILQNQIPPEKPGMLNVLTILTFIGCAFSYIFSIFGALNSSNYETQHEKLLDAQEKAGSSGFARNMIDKSLETLENNAAAIDRMHDYRYIILVLGLLFTTLCLLGALQMRKLKKSGYPIYVIGEIAPLVVSVAFSGFMMFSNVFGYIMIAIPVLFVILYTSQRKYLVN